MRTESSVRAGEKTDSSTSSTSISRAAPTFSYSSTTRSQMAYITAIGPCSSTLARCSRSRRAVLRSMPCPCRTVTTKSGPMKRLISPVSTASCSSTYQRVLRTRNNVSP